MCVGEGGDHSTQFVLPSQKRFVFCCSCTLGLEYVKVILRNGRMVGTILIGKTDLEVTARTHTHTHILLDPDIDIGDYYTLTDS